MIILPPEQPKPAPTPAPIKPTILVDHFDSKLVEAIGQQGDQLVPLWPVIHEIIAGEHPVDRTQQRRLGGRLLCRVRSLLRRGVITRDGKGCVRLSNPLPAPPATASPASLPTPAPVKNWPPSPFPTVGDLGNLSSAGPRRRVFRV